MDKNNKVQISEEFLCETIKSEMLNMFFKKLKHIESLTKQYPNDYELGQAVREYITNKKDNKS